MFCLLLLLLFLCSQTFNVVYIVIHCWCGYGRWQHYLFSYSTLSSSCSLLLLCNNNVVVVTLRCFFFILERLCWCRYCYYYYYSCCYCVSCIVLLFFSFDILSLHLYWFILTFVWFSFSSYFSLFCTNILLLFFFYILFNFKCHILGITVDFNVCACTVGVF